MMEDTLTRTAAVEDRQETANALLREYAEALIAAQTSHDPWDWMAAGSIFKRYAAALVIATDKDAAHG